MFQAVFSLDQKKLYYYQKKKTILLEKKEFATKIAVINMAIKPDVQAKWELNIIAN